MLQGRIANNNSETARTHYENSLEQWQTLITSEDNNPRWQEKMGHVQFYLGLWWKNDAERNRPKFTFALNQARKYFTEAIKTFEDIDSDDFTGIGIKASIKIGKPSISINENHASSTSKISIYLQGGIKFLERWTWIKIPIPSTQLTLGLYLEKDELNKTV